MLPFPDRFITVREFVLQMYRLINASNPTIPMQGDDEKLAVRVLNQIMQSYASSGLMLTIAKTVSVPINLGMQQIVFTDPNYSTSTSQYENVVLTSGLPTFLVADGTKYSIGDAVVGNGVPLNALIINIVVNTVTLNVNATITGTSTLQFIHTIVDPTLVYIKQGRLANLDDAWLSIERCNVSIN